MMTAIVNLSWVCVHAWMCSNQISGDSDIMKFSCSGNDGGHYESSLEMGKDVEN